MKGSYGAGALRPYRVRALRWLGDHRDEHSVQLAVNAVSRLYMSAGRYVEAFRLAGRPPTERARAAWAALRERQIDPLEVLAMWLAVDARLRDDPQADRHEEYRHVQVAKLVHRAAGGAHKRWEQELNGRVKVIELHKHPISRGRVLRLIGSAAAKACDGLNAEEAFV